MAIKVRRDDRANAVIFEGSTLPSYWNGLLTASLFSGSTGSGSNDTINVINIAGTSGSAWNDPSASVAYEYYNVEYTLFNDADGNPFSTSQETINYINGIAQQHSPLSGFETILADTLGSNTTFNISTLSATPVTMSFSGSSNNYNTFVPEDITQIYDTGSYCFFFEELDEEDTLQVVIEYLVNTDVADAGHEIEMRFRDNQGNQYSRSTTQTQVQSADEDVEYLTTIPFVVGNNLIRNGSQTGSAQLFFNPDVDSTIKIKNITTYLTR